MKPEVFRLNEIYQHRDSRHSGRAVMIQHDVVSLVDESGRNFSASLETLVYPPVKSDGTYWINLNSNYPRPHAGAFLCRKYLQGESTDLADYVSIGGADLVMFGDLKGHWQVTVDAPYDEATGADARCLGYYSTQQEAIEALWNERHHICTD